MMSRGPLILLAVNSPIFAPIVLAKALNLGKLGPVELRVVGAERSPRVPSVPRVDPLVRQVLARTPATSRPIVGVGDPMRLAAINADEPGFLEPVLLGSLITKMCYWILHDIQGYDHVGKCWEQFYRALITHQEGMTGYTVPLYDLKARGQSAGGRLYGDFTDPDDEFRFYSQVRRLWLRKRPSGGPPPAFITTNPLHAARAGVHGSRFTMVKEYPREEGFKSVVMSALFTAKWAAHSHAKGLVKSLLEAIPEAIQIITASPDFAAVHILDGFARDPELVSGTSPCFGLDGLRSLADCLGHLAHADVFNTAADLRAKPDAITNTLSIREHVEDLLDERFRQRKAVEMADLFTPIRGLV